MIGSKNLKLERITGIRHDKNQMKTMVKVKEDPNKLPIGSRSMKDVSNTTKEGFKK